MDLKKKNFPSIFYWASKVLEQPTLNVFQFTFYLVAASVAPCRSPMPSVPSPFYANCSLTIRICFYLSLVSYWFNLLLPQVPRGGRSFSRSYLSAASVAHVISQWQQEKSLDVYIIK